MNLIRFKREPERVFYPGLLGNCGVLQPQPSHPSATSTEGHRPRNIHQGFSPLHISAGQAHISCSSAYTRQRMVSDHISFYIRSKLREVCKPRVPCMITWIIHQPISLLLYVYSLRHRPLGHQNTTQYTFTTSYISFSQLLTQRYKVVRYC
jgi:hypothetical protein